MGNWISFSFHMSLDPDYCFWTGYEESNFLLSNQNNYTFWIFGAINLFHVKIFKIKNKIFYFLLCDLGGNFFGYLKYIFIINYNNTWIDISVFPSITNRRWENNISDNNLISLRNIIFLSLFHLRYKNGIGCLVENKKFNWVIV